MSRNRRQKKIKKDQRERERYQFGVEVVGSDRSHASEIGPIGREERREEKLPKEVMGIKRCRRRRRRKRE